MKQTHIKHRKWYHQEIEMVRHLISVQGLSHSQVAERFGTSKNAIIGLCNRKKIKHGDDYVRVHKPVTNPKHKVCYQHA